MNADVWIGALSPGGLALPAANPTDAQLYAPRGVYLDDSKLIVCDSGNHRIMIWHDVPTDDQAPADVVLGQPDFQSEGPAAGGRGPGNGLHLPTGVTVIDGRLVVADAWHHRILVWNEIPRSNDLPPDYALGQTDLEQTQPNQGGGPRADTFYWPYGVAYINDMLYVADTGNRRVLAWHGFPETGQPADVILGQPDGESKDENRGGPVSADSFRWSHDFAGDDKRLFVADAGNHRVLGWQGHPSQDRPADVALGQKDLSSAYELPYDKQGPSRLRFPYAIDMQEDLLAVADTANNRILFWDVRDTTNYSPANAVIGQPDLDSNGENQWTQVARDTLCWPYGISLHDGRLAVADSGNNRVVIFDCKQILSDVAENKTAAAT